MGKILVGNNKARFNYEFLDKYMAGIVLTGSEVKSLRTNNANIRDAYCLFENGELWMVNSYIHKLNGCCTDHDEYRKRKLLLNKKELSKLEKAIQTPGLTIVPILMFEKGPFVKVDIVLAKGKKDYDKRESIKKRDIEREYGKILHYYIF